MSLSHRHLWEFVASALIMNGQCLARDRHEFLAKLWEASFSRGPWFVLIELS